MFGRGGCCGRFRSDGRGYRDDGGDGGVCWRDKLDVGMVMPELAGRIDEAAGVPNALVQALCCDDDDGGRDQAEEYDQTPVGYHSGCHHGAGGRKVGQGRCRGLRWRGMDHISSTTTRRPRLEESAGQP